MKQYLVLNLIVIISSTIFIHAFHNFDALTLKSGHEKMWDSVKNNDVQAFKRLLSNRDVTPEDINGPNSESKATLVSAAEKNYKEMVQALIDAGAHLDQEDREGWTALMYAAWKNHKEIVQALVDAGADVNIKGKWDMTALMWAVSGGHTEIVTLLVGHEADITMKDHEGKKVLDHAPAEMRESMRQAINKGLKLRVEKVKKTEDLVTLHADLPRVLSRITAEYISTPEDIQI